MSMDWTFGSEVMRNPWHIPLVRSNLTRNLGVLFPEVREELIMAFNKSIPPSEDWVSVPLLETLRTIVSQTSNRIFVGAPACESRNLSSLPFILIEIATGRDPDYVQLNIDFTVHAVTASIILNLVPKFLHPYVFVVIYSSVWVERIILLESLGDS